MAKAVRNYIVTIPFRGEDYVLVPATSAAEAIRKANERTDDVEPIDFQPTHRYRATTARLDEAIAAAPKLAGGSE